jgi:hypothetical protein
MATGVGPACPLADACRRAATALVAAALVAGALGACGLGDKRAMTDRLIAAADKTIAAGSVDGLYQFSFAVIETTGFAPKALGQKVAPLPAAPFEIDFAHNRSALLAPADLGGVAPLYIFSKSTLYGRKVGVAGTAVQRPWVKLNFARLDNDASERLDPGSVVALPYNLSLQVRLLRGALTGSVKRIGVATVDGLRTTHYEMNVDRDKAVKGLPDASKNAIAKVFRATSFHDTVYKADAWLDDRGLPRRIRIRFQQQITKKDRFRIVVDTRITKIGDRSVKIDKPTTDQISEVKALPQLVEALGQR